MIANISVYTVGAITVCLQNAYSAILFASFQLPYSVIHTYVRMYVCITVHIFNPMCCSVCFDYSRRQKVAMKNTLKTGALPKGPYINVAPVKVSGWDRVQHYTYKAL